MTQKVYPNIEVRIRKIDGRATLLLESCVHVKRKGKWYGVKVGGDYEIGDNAEETIKIMEVFHASCVRTKYLWMRPNKAMRKKMYEKDLLKKVTLQLTDKEIFLLDFNKF
jgi:hypothetical protein